METAKCLKCGKEALAFICGEGNLMDLNNTNVIQVVRFFRTRKGFESWLCDVCEPPINYDDE